MKKEALNPRLFVPTGNPTDINLSTTDFQMRGKLHIALRIHMSSTLQHMQFLIQEGMHMPQSTSPKVLDLSSTLLSTQSRVSWDNPAKYLVALSNPHLLWKYASVTSM